MHASKLQLSNQAVDACLPGSCLTLALDGYRKCGTFTQWSTTCEFLIREAVNIAWLGLQVPCGRIQHRVTLCTELADTPKVPRGLSMQS
jgi:hypothetical protein